MVPPLPGYANDRQQAMPRTRSGTNLKISKEAQVGRQLVCGRTEAGQRRQSVDVDFPRVRLRGHWVSIRETAQRRHEFIQLLDLIV